jgi:hypothetical protein
LLKAVLSVEDLELISYVQLAIFCIDVYHTLILINNITAYYTDPKHQTFSKQITLILKNIHRFALIMKV